MKSADEVFVEILDSRGIHFEPTSDDRYRIQIAGQTILVSLDNIRLDYERVRDAGLIRHFVDRVCDPSLLETPEWEAVKPGLRYSLEPSDYVGGFQGFLSRPVCEGLTRLCVYVDQEQGGISWVSDDDLEHWQVSRSEIYSLAQKNMSAVLSDATVEVQTINGHKLGFLSTPERSFKASLIMSTRFQELVSESLGWPVYVVSPCRDSVYVIPLESRGFLGRLGAVVIKEFRESGYPITKDVLEVSDEGIRVIGTYSDPDESSD